MNLYWHCLRKTPLLAEQTGPPALVRLTCTLLTTQRLLQLTATSVPIKVFKSVKLIENIEKLAYVGILF
jgi:hypothetical protein